MRAIYNSGALALALLFLFTTYNPQAIRLSKDFEFKINIDGDESETVPIQSLVARDHSSSTDKVSYTRQISKIKKNLKDLEVSVTKKNSEEDVTEVKKMIAQFKQSIPEIEKIA